MARMYVWQVVETAGFETTWVERDGDGLRLRALGRTTGQLPEPFWMSYTLETDSNAATTRLDVRARLAGSERRLELCRGADGWTVDGEPRPDLDGALDCDLAGSPLTNTMPIIRHGLHRGPGEHAFTMAFVEVPALRVTAVAQNYRHLAVVEAGARVRYSAGAFAAELLVDSDGMVLDYPTMAHRIRPETAISGSERTGGPGSLRPA
jgi:uncharacterized protein